MAKSKKPGYRCRECGHAALSWTGQCPGCGAWNTLAEERSAPAGSQSSRRSGNARPATVTALREIGSRDAARIPSGLGELDRTLGGGLVRGSLVLLGGEPGIGKSTITAMALGEISGRGERGLYVTGEESVDQVRMRAERLGEDALGIPAIAETDLARVIATLEAEQPAVCVIDSIQTMRAAELDAAPGSVAQVRECAGALMDTAKSSGTALVLVGHVTKEGAVAGPRALEHLVDCVLLFEGERDRSYRTLRALKNRFGPTNEVGVFEMRSGGLVEVADPSARFAAEAASGPGSCLLASMEGTRPVIVEVQALVAPTDAVPARRVANGIDRNRLAMVIAVLARHGGPSLGSSDVFVSVAGGVRVTEPGADLAVALALASAHSGRPLRSPERPWACFGEIGLTGELRPVAHADRRVAEARKFGLSPVLGPPESEPLDGLAARASVREALRVPGAGEGTAAAA